MEVPDQFEQVRLFLHDNGLVPILQEVPGSRMPTIDGPRVAREEGAHAAGEGASARADQQVEVIREQSPGEDREGPSLGQPSQASDEVGPVDLIPKDDLPIESAHHHAVQEPVEDSGRSAEGIQARLAT
jgi:hypothetical protein